MASPRVRKIADRIKVIVAEMLERRIKDPRLGFVTVTDVRVSGDTQQATVFYTVLGEDKDLEGTAVALASAKGLIRSEVGKQLGGIVELDGRIGGILAIAAEIDVVLGANGRTALAA